MTVDSLVRVVTPKYWVALLAFGVFLVGVLAWSLFGTVDQTVAGNGVVITGSAVRQVNTPTASVLQTYQVQLGESVAVGSTVATVTATDGTTTTAITAPVAGTVSGLSGTPGQPLRAGESIATLADPAASLDVVGTVAAADANSVVPGLAVQITPLGLNGAGAQTVNGTVQSVSALPVSAAELAASVGSISLAHALTNGQSVKQVLVTLDQDPTTSSGYAVSNQNGDSMPIRFGMQVELQVVVATEHPISQVLR